MIAEAAGERAVADAEEYVQRSAVHFDELDAMGLLHNVRLVRHVERAIIAFYHSVGRRWVADVSLNPDQFHAVRELRVEYLQPFVGTGDLWIRLWVERLGESSCTYGFRCTSEDGAVVYARGSRAIVKIDPATMRPAAWTEFFRGAHEPLLRTGAGA